MVGESGVGKSSLTMQLIQKQFVEDYDPTIENLFRKQVTIDDETYLLDVLDTAGEEEYDVMRYQNLQAAQGFVFTYSITSRRTFDEMVRHHEQVLQAKDEDRVPMVLAANVI
jgi:GTPase KRas